MNRKLVIGAVAGVAAVALAYGGTTYSAWSDFGDVTDNSVGAGVLVLNLKGNQGADIHFDNVKMAPGQIAQERHVYIASNSSQSTPNAKLFVSLKNLKGIEDGCNGNGEVLKDPQCNDTETSQGQFITDATSQWTSYKVNSPEECEQTYAPSGTSITGQFGPTLLKQAQATATTPHELTGTALPVLTPGQGLCFSMTVSLGDVSNASQGDSAEFDLHFDLVQA